MPEQALAAGLQRRHAAAGLVKHQPQELRPREPVPVCLVDHPVQRRKQHLRKAEGDWCNNASSRAPVSQGRKGGPALSPITHALHPGRAHPARQGHTILLTHYVWLEAVNMLSGAVLVSQQLVLQVLKDSMLWWGGEGCMP